jgi:tetratricopeptide (TPR) repeat protein
VKWLLSPDDRPDWQAALDLVQRSQEPVMAFVCTGGEPLAANMEMQTFGHPEVDKALRGFVCVRANPLQGKDQPFVDKYGVGRRDMDLRVDPRYENDLQVEGPGRVLAYPVTLFLAPDGQLEHLVYGFVIPDDFLAVLQRVTEILQIRGQLAKNEADAGAWARLGGLYVELQRLPAGREALEKALALDADGKLGIGESVLLDLAIAYTAAGDAGQAVEVVRQHIRAYPDSEQRCKAQYLLGGALLASVEPDRLAVEELTGTGDAQGATEAGERLALGRRQAEEAWAWFEGGANAPCAKTDWASYSLGALAELRAEMARDALDREVQRLLGEGKTDAAVEKLRAFAKEHPGTDRGCEASFTAGEILLEAGKRAEALAQWERLADPDDKRNPCARTLWRGQAEGAVQANKAGN